MGIRDSINNKSSVTLGIVVALVLAAIGLAIYSVLPDSTPGAAHPDQIYYSVDDGATYFAGEKNALPFEKDGKPAAIAHVYKKENGELVVAYLERLNPAAAKKLKDAGKTIATVDMTAQWAGMVATSMECKRPKEANWVSNNSTGGSVILASGKSSATDKAVEVFP